MHKIFLFTLLSFIINTSFGQNSFGLRGGFNVSKFSGSNTQHRLGGFAGGVLKVKLTDLLFLQPEILYSSKGFSNEPPQSSPDVSVRMNYLSLPILLGFQVQRKLSLAIGGEVSYLVRHVDLYKNADPFLWKKPGYPKVDYGIAGDIGYKLSNSLIANLRYIHGFNTLYWTDGAGVAHDEIKQGNRTLQLGISYLFKRKNSR